jgi:hypothetical protein
LSLAGVKVGDEVVVTIARIEAAQREKVTAVGRKYITVGGCEYAIADGSWKRPGFESHRRVYTLEQWQSVELRSRLDAAILRIARMRIPASLSDCDLHEATRMLDEVARKLGGGT